jgi:transposase-like protein
LIQVRQEAGMSSSATKSRYAGYRFPAEVINQAVWLYFRFPLSLRMVEEMLAARGIELCGNLGDAVIRRRSALACR